MVEVDFDVSLGREEYIFGEVDAEEDLEFWLGERYFGGRKIYLPECGAGTRFTRE